MPRRITPEFKRECAELVITLGYSHKDAAAAMNVGLSSIQRWCKRRTKTRKRFTINAKTQTTTNGIEVNIAFFYNRRKAT
ncbi:hypothetical protein Q8W13_22885 [Photobacterium damselae subsp. piscicida]|nr:hypothetical protein [Photobacterium damselae subsp. piscicida]